LRELKMTDYAQSVLDHYGLSTPYPLEWPPEKDDSDASEEDDPETKQITKTKGSKSRYLALARATSDRKSPLPGSQKTNNGVENLVQRDEPDPLGSTESVVRILRQLGLPVQDDSGLRKCIFYG